MFLLSRFIFLSSLACLALGCASNLQEGIDCFHNQHYRQAFIRLKPEANKGQAEAAYAVGYMYYYGKGVVENRKEASFWIDQAARAGQQDALKALEILKNEPRQTDTNPLAPLI